MVFHEIEQAMCLERREHGGKMAFRLQFVGWTSISSLLPIRKRTIHRIGMVFRIC
jgi:hypothetical protein